MNDITVKERQNLPVFTELTTYWESSIHYTMIFKAIQ
jgi:hypothetical protein